MKLEKKKKKKKKKNFFFNFFFLEKKFRVGPEIFGSVGEPETQLFFFCPYIQNLVKMAQWFLRKASFNFQKMTLTLDTHIPS